MLINSVILILREVLEAALIVSVFLALSQKLQLSRRWLIPTLLFGFVSAVIYALNIQAISQAFEGIGQEIVNASLQLVIFGCIALFVFIIKNEQHHQRTVFIIICCISVAVIREGAEIIIYLRGLIAIPELRSPVMIGSIIGAGIGASVGVFFYYLIANLTFRNGLRLGLFLLILIAGGMVLQATQLLIQADLINSQQALWNSSSFISERSLVGQLLYALIGYEATPTPIQVFAYLCSLFIMIIFTVSTLNHFKQREAL
jgi:high-affinity iron transporter